jgi:hypothetical protein
MLQTVPDTPAICPEIDIFDGFGPIMGVSHNFQALSSSSTSDFKTSTPEFKLENTAMTPFDKRIEELGSPVGADNANNSPFTSPSIISNSIDYPGLTEFAGFPDMSGSNGGSQLRSHNHQGNFGEGVGGGGRQTDFKTDFETNLGLAHNAALGIRRPPLRHNSTSSFGMQIPRRISEFHGLQRTNSHDSTGVMNVPNDVSFQ